MAATVLLNQPRGFQTTMGFQINTGFHMPAASSTKASPPPVETPAEPIQMSPQKQDTPKRHGVGWSGLLEASRASGVSGVMGKLSVSGDGDPLMSPKLEICCTAHTNPAVRRLVKNVIRGLKACQEPEKALDGMGGTYFFLNDAGRKAAIIKPCDEEPLAPNNPKGYVGRQLGDAGWKPTVRVGEAAMREVAAYLLDYDQFARVPTSVLVRARHPVFCYQDRVSGAVLSPGPRSSLDLCAVLSSGLSSDMEDGRSAVPVPTSPGGFGYSQELPMKLGSLQEFVNHECDTSEMGASRFAVGDVHRIGILDIRLFNTDRHAGNMLVRVAKAPSSANLSALDVWTAGASKYELVPIDHGFCLPETLEAPYFEWLHWPQAMMPFTQEELAYIRDLNIEADKDLLRKELPNLRPECLRVLEVATTLLQAGAAAGLTLFELASIMTRGMLPGGDEEPSELETMVAAAREAAEAEQDHIASEESEDDDDEDDFDEDEDVSATSFLEVADMDISPDVSPVAGAGPGIPMVRGSATHRSDGEVMLFSLDEDAAGRKLRTQSSSIVSAGSSVSSGGHLSLTTSLESAPVTPRMIIGGGGGGGAHGCTSDGADNNSLTFPSLAASSMAMPMRTPDSAVVAFAPVARSVAVDGSIWRRHQKQRRRGVGVRRPAPQAYPPPVMASIIHPSTGSVFSDLSEPQWAVFMSALRCLIMAGLAAGRWRTAAKTTAAPGGVAMSCPRY